MFIKLNKIISNTLFKISMICYKKAMRIRYDILKYEPCVINHERLSDEEVDKLLGALKKDSGCEDGEK